LWRVCGTKRDEATGEWRKLHNDELNNLYSLPNIEKNEMGGACGAYGGEVCTGYWWKSQRERDHWGDPDVDGRILIVKMNITVKVIFIIFTIESNTTRWTSMNLT
jgi:hypothetical protein